MHPKKRQYSPFLRLALCLSILLLTQQEAITQVFRSERVFYTERHQCAAFICKYEASHVEEVILSFFQKIPLKTDTFNQQIYYIIPSHNISSKLPTGHFIVHIEAISPDKSIIYSTSFDMDKAQYNNLISEKNIASFLKEYYNKFELACIDHLQVKFKQEIYRKVWQLESQMDSIQNTIKALETLQNSTKIKIHELGSEWYKIRQIHKMESTLLENLH